MSCGRPAGACLSCLEEHPGLWIAESASFHICYGNQSNGYSNHYTHTHTGREREREREREINMISTL